MKFCPLPLRNKLLNPIRDLAENGKLSGILLILATVISIVFSNCQNASFYLGIWQTEIGPAFLSKSIVHWINDGLMPLFFLLVGIEIKRELVSGELSGFRQAILPAFGALGGMAVPAVIYIIFAGGNPETSHGWAIPTATDIAFSLGLISLLGKRVPFVIKIFLTALAIIDDLGAIIIIAIFYSSNIQLLMMLMVILSIIALLVMNRFNVKWIFPYLIAGVILWYFIMRSGIHPTIAGVILALTIPVSLAERLEEKLTKTVYYLILPLFALANMAIPYSFDIAVNLFSPMSLGIILGLVIGKPLGIIIFTYALVKSKVSGMLTGISWIQMIGVGMVAGIGFTMSIFIASLSFHSDFLSDTSKLAIMAGSLVSALAGFFVLWQSLKARKDDECGN
jgi:Na+:H+ antiporter, NhaA family